MVQNKVAEEQVGPHLQNRAYYRHEKKTHLTLTQFSLNMSLVQLPCPVNLL